MMPIRSENRHLYPSCIVPGCYREAVTELCERHRIAAYGGEEDWLGKRYASKGTETKWPTMKSTPAIKPEPSSKRGVTTSSVVPG